MRKFDYVLMIFVFAILLEISPLYADGAGPLYGTNQASRISNKLLRGIINIPLCVMEIPKSINTHVKNTDIFTGTFVGMGEGAYKSSKRLCYGIFETATFPCPKLKTLNSWVDHPIPFKELAE